MNLYTQATCSYLIIVLIIFWRVYFNQSSVWPHVQYGTQQSDSGPVSITLLSSGWCSKCCKSLESKWLHLSDTYTHLHTQSMWLDFKWQSQFSQLLKSVHQPNKGKTTKSIWTMTLFKGFLHNNAFWMRTFSGGVWTHRGFFSCIYGHAVLPGVCSVYTDTIQRKPRKSERQRTDRFNTTCSSMNIGESASSISGWEMERRFEQRQQYKMNRTNIIEAGIHSIILHMNMHHSAFYLLIKCVLRYLHGYTMVRALC